MSRKRKGLYITVKSYQPLVPGRRYMMKVKKIEEIHDSQLQVVVEHQETEQLGRSHSILIPPLYPEGPTADLFKACGVDQIEQGTQINLEKMEGAILIVVFNRSTDIQNWQDVSFEPHSLEVNFNESTT